LAYPSGISDSIIQSGQAFFVHATSSGTAKRVYDAAPAAITFTEDAKVNGGGTVNFTRKAENISTQLHALSASLFTGPDKSDVMADGNVAVFGEKYNDKFDRNDALKITNSGENFGLKAGNKLLSIEARGPLTASDTLYYDITHLARRTYQLRFAPVNLQSTGLHAFLIDAFLKTEAPVSLADSSFINIAVTSNTASAASDRFKVVFRQMNLLPVTITSVYAKEKDAENLIGWNVANENGIRQYEVEKSKDGSQFSQIAIAAACSAAKGSYSATDNNASSGTNYYRIKIVSMDGKASYSSVVKIINESKPGAISVYPNPITDNVIHLQFHQQPAGRYQIKLYSAGGQVLLSKGIHHTEGSSSENIKCENLPKGMYQLMINTPAGKTENIQIIK